MTWGRADAVIVENDGIRRRLVDLCRERGVDYDVARARIRTLGWDVERALSTPPAGRSRSIDPRFCVRGHPWSSESIRLTKAGYRTCKICAALR